MKKYYQPVIEVKNVLIEDILSVSGENITVTDDIFGFEGDSNEIV